MTVRSVVTALIAFATLFAAANVGVGWLYALGFLFLAYLVLAYGFALGALRGLKVTVHAPHWATAGEPCELQVGIEAPGDRPFLVLLAPPLGSRQRLHFFRGRLIPEGWGHALIQELSRHEAALIDLPLPATRRGIWALGAIAVQAPAFGLGGVHRAVPTAARVIVRPRVVPLPQLAWLTGDQGEERPERRLGGSGSELIKTVRDYRPGDPLRSVHWRSTARTGELRIKETESELVSGSWAIALDLAPAAAERFEHAVVIAASLCAYARSRGTPVPIFSQMGSPPSTDLEAQLDWLAAVQMQEQAVPLRLDPQRAILLVTTRHEGPEQPRWRLVVGPEAPVGAIACPLEVDLGRVLGREAPWR